MKPPHPKANAATAGAEGGKAGRGLTLTPAQREILAREAAKRVAKS